ncbi:MAG: DUF721 domain-containing protein [Acidimicrobiia bacterium]
MKAKYLNSDTGRDPAPIGDVIGSVIENATVSVDVRHGQMISEWDTFAPSDWVTFGRPIGVRERALLVEVSNGSAASLLKYQTSDLVAAIETRYGPDLVSGVRVRVERRARRD